jgi:GWxTD domain-containing protein
LVLTGCLVVCPDAATAAKPRRPQRLTLADLTNPFLSPERTGWLIGAVSRLATQEEIDGYLALRDDAQAKAFVDGFWQRRDPDPLIPGNPVREHFEARSAQADKAFGEAGYLGRRTDRGTIFVLYGPPEAVDFEVGRGPSGSPVEKWIYTEKTPSGLDGKRPQGAYRFAKRGDLTVFYLPHLQPRLPNPD